MTARDVMAPSAERLSSQPGSPLVQTSIDVDLDGRILQSRALARETAGILGPHLVGRYVSDLFIADDALAARALLHRAARDGTTAPMFSRMRRIDGGEIVVRASAHWSDFGITIRIRAADATEQSLFHAGAARRVRFDPLTGLPNRLLLMERAAAALAATPQTLALIDLDRFRHRVTALGVRTGDRLLVEVGDRLIAAFGSSGIVGLSGEQFAVLVPVASVKDLATFTTRLRTAIGAPLIANGDAILFNTCLGFASASADAESLFCDAEVALTQAKSLGPAHAAIFDPAFRRRALRQVELQGDLSRAISDDELRLNYQPIVALDTSAIVGYEALVRWEHPSLGLLEPRNFLGMAQRTGAGSLIDDWVLGESCRQAARWEPAGVHKTICVNVAPERFALDGFVERVEAALSGSGLDPSRLVIEITEWSVLADLSAARRTLEALKALGVRVALDDFGTGYSSLADVAALAVDELKIDASFVAGIGSDRVRTAIVSAIVGLGRALDIAVVAEGVERTAQAAALRAMGCEFGQGFHFGRPAPEPPLVVRRP